MAPGSYEGLRPSRDPQRRPQLREETRSWFGVLDRRVIHIPSYYTTILQANQDVVPTFRETYPLQVFVLQHVPSNVFHVE
jgi:hypothetical protein